MMCGLLPWYRDFVEDLRSRNLGTRMDGCAIAIELRCAIKGREGGKDGEQHVTFLDVRMQCTAHCGVACPVLVETSFLWPILCYSRCSSL